MTAPADQPPEGPADAGSEHRPSLAIVAAPVDGAELSDSEQTLADSDQTLADTDQTSSDGDQTSAENDQLAADRDQAASDHDLARGVDPGAHQLSRDIRKRSTLQREHSAQARLDSASRRDAIASARDLAAAARDQAAEVRDLAIAQRDDAFEQEFDVQAVTGGDAIARATAQRTRAAEHRTRAAEHRALAAQDRQSAADDRQQAAAERLRALVDRETLTRELAIAETDPLTKARTRAAGLIDLEHELDRCRRTGGRLIVAYVDVVGLKTVNDSKGHAAGDDLIRGVVTLIREHLRSYDLVIRIGGDEFLCVVTAMTMADARQRFSAIDVALAARDEPGAIRTGFAELAPHESAAEVIARADNDLIDLRRGGSGRQARP